MDRVWVRVPAGAKDVLTTALERGLSTFVVDAGDVEAFRRLAKARFLTLDGKGLHEDGALVAPRVTVASGADQERALALAGREREVLVQATDWKVIPYENLIATYRQKGTKLVVEAATVDEVAVLLDTLEVGVDAVVFDAPAVPDVLALARALGARGKGTVELEVARVVGTRPVGTGDRVCVDTASLLGVGEGMLVGSSSSALFLVHAESLESEYVAARPFRVNAGPVHAYVLLPDGRTKYLSELRAGDSVLAVDAAGATRTVVVGRTKVETRPLLLVEAEVGGRRVATMLQNAETIRLTTPKGAVSVVDLRAGDEVYVRTETTGRHFGTAVRETIREH